MVRPPPLAFSDVVSPLARFYERTLERSSERSARGGAEPQLFEASRAAIARWLELLCDWNGRIDLTAARSGGELVDLMLEDAGAISRSLSAGARVLDVGTGAGAPGMALALLRPDLVMTLCEPLTKRASFLRTVIGSVGRTDITLVAKRGEELKRGEWDEVMARATLPPEEWLALGAKLVKPGGNVWVLLAAGEPPALPGTNATLDERYTWGETRAVRRVVRYQTAQTVL